MPGEIDAAAVEELIAVGPDRVARLADWRLMVEPTAKANILHVSLPEQVPGGASLAGLGKSQIHLLAPDAALTPRALVPWLERRSAATRAWVETLMAPAALTDPTAAALMRELRQGSDGSPQAVLSHLSVTRGGILFALELTDPCDLVRSVRIERRDDAEEFEASGRTVGFAALRGREDDPCRIRLVYRSGRLATIHDGPPTALAEIPSAFAGAQGAVALALARLSLDRVGPIAIETFGAVHPEPPLSILAGVGANLDTIRARAALLFGEPKGRAVELVYHVADGRARRGGAGGHRARGGGLRHRAPAGDAARRGDGSRPPPRRARGGDRAAAARPRGGCAAGRNRAGSRPGWAGSARAVRFSAGRCSMPAARWSTSAACRRDGDLPVAGAGRWDGRPGSSARATAATELVTADCVGMTRSVASLLSGSTPHYPSPDVMLARAVQAVRRRGQEARMLPQCRFVRYGGRPGAEPAGGGGRTRAALALVLKPLFRPGADEGRP